MNLKVNVRIEDAGEKLGGARKDGVAANDPRLKTPAIRLLEQLWSRPERWTDLVPTLGAQRAALCMVTWENLATSPHKQGWLGLSAEQWRELYVFAVELLRQLLTTPGNANTAAIEDEFEMRMIAFGHRISGSDHVAKRSVYAAGQAHRRRTNHPFGRSPIDDLRVKYLHCWGWGVDVRVGDRLAMGALKLKNKRSGATYWHAVQAHAGCWVDLSKTDFATEQEAIECVRVHVEKALAETQTKTDGKTKRPTWVRPLAAVDQPLRVGFPIANSTGRSELELLSTFGFRGIEFGNWVTQAQRQWFVDAAFDAFGDLIQLLGVHHRFASLNGVLGLAYGSRGEGLSRSAAHFEPGRWVLHLTKESGPGSIAHEFAHAWDCWMAEQDWKSSRQATQRRPDGAALAVVRQERFLSECWPVRTAMESTIRSAFKQWADRLPWHNEHTMWQWAIASEQLDVGRKRYWSTPCEMFARSFEVLVYDSLALRGRRNDMLVLGVGEGDGQARESMGNPFPYPLGDERAQTCRLMAAILRACKACLTADR